MRRNSLILRKRPKDIGWDEQGVIGLCTRSGRILNWMRLIQAWLGFGWIEAVLDCLQWWHQNKISGQCTEEAEETSRWVSCVLHIKISERKMTVYYNERSPEIGREQGRDGQKSISFGFSHFSPHFHINLQFLFEVKSSRKFISILVPDSCNVHIFVCGVS